MAETGYSEMLGGAAQAHAIEAPIVLPDSR